ncbi:PAS domain S-box protein [Methanolobus sp. WCC4]|uniref:PAS domain-containing sensor histidine kinase n=1 Tax=Methanolobus sp. WCC4 TaxID=3125784 RepID=UPI0030F68B45
MVKSKEKLESVFRAAPIGIGVVKNRILTEVNSRLCEITGYSYDELVGSSSRILYPNSKEYEYVGKEKYQQIAEKGTGTVETKWERKDGSIIDILLSSTPIDQADHSYGVTFTALDITERKSTEETLRIIAETAVSPEEDIFSILVRQIAVSQNIRTVVLASMDPDELRTAHTVAVWDDSDHTDNFTYDIIGTPCEDLTSGEPCFYPSGIQTLFPGDTILKKVNAESYWGTPLKDSEGRMIGLLVILDEKPMEHSTSTHSILNSFAARAAAEMERRKAEEALRESERKFRSYVDNSPSGLIVTDKEGYYIDVNRAFCNITSYSRNELLSMNVLDVLPAEEKDHILKLSDELKEKGSLTAELPFVRKNGCKGYWAVDAVKLSDDGFLAIHTDITDRINAEEMLRSVTQRLTLATRAAKIGIWEWDMLTSTLIWDRQLHEIYGTEPSEFTGDFGSWKEMIHPEDLNEVLNAIDNAVIGKEEFNSEFRIICADGNVRFIEAHGIVKHDKKGVPVKMIGTNGDITERKMFEKNLKDSEERLGLAVETSGLGLWELDLNKSIMYQSPQMIATLGMDDETYSTDLDFYFDRIHPEDRKIVMSEFDKAIELADEFHLDCRIKHASGEWIWVSLKGKPFETGRSRVPQRFVGTQMDITPRVKAEEALLYSKIISDDANRIKSEFMKNMSHELRTPLTAVIGFSDVLLYQSSEGLSESQKNYVRYINNSGKNLLDLINRLLDLSKYEIDDLENISFKCLSTGDFVSETMMLMSKRASSRDIKLSFKRKDSIDVFYADEYKLTQIMHNLLDNALKFTDHGGSVVIETKNVGDKLQVSVIDTGIGIEKDKIESIFKPFVQIDGSFARKYSGTGIGLALTKKFIELHGGNITVKSEPGKGSNFTFEIPINPR